MSGYSDRDQNKRGESGEGEEMGWRWLCSYYVCLYVGKAGGAAEKNCTIWVMSMALGRFILLVRSKEAGMLV